MKICAAIIAIMILVTGCAGTNTEGITKSLIDKRAIKVNRISENIFEIHMYEHKVSPMELYGINTMTSDDRKAVARDVMSFEPKFGGSVYPICLVPIEVLNEADYQVTDNHQRWLNTRWWKLTVQCSNVND
ncbi:hypothetical protein [Shewanella dokdonensis]|uniref:Lipoprotein n=1 Tax=Shewanella dokdonensis TaxID=712036 RepID=A0ABX8DGT3_9GAMM|nr:hypothetical protein [Shewanella dokdonensis]MCL1072968.1 hypothetical protein [Shewanella dokdonensis]QVK23112.1 hypothetical protein KHX94_18810 [Shewanella dokdonensis]